MSDRKSKRRRQRASTSGPSPSLYMTSRQLCDRVGISPATEFRLRSNGDLGRYALVFGRTVAYRLNDWPEIEALFARPTAARSVAPTRTEDAA